MKKQINFSEEARQKLEQGVTKLEKAVTSTLGPSGRNVLIEQNEGYPVSTKDGVTVAKAINLEDSIENIGAQLVKQVASKTNDLAGDGTTTSTLLASIIYRHGLSKIKNNVNIREVQKGIIDATKDVITYLQDNSVEITENEQIKQIATISSNNDPQIGGLIASAVESVGTDGVITAEESRTGETYLEIVEGIEFERGYKSPYFVTNNKTMQAELENPVVIIVDHKVTSAKELVQTLEYYSQKSKSVLLIAEDIEGELLSTLVVNKMRNILNCVAVKAPDFGERRSNLLEDIATLTGGTVVSKQKGMTLDKFNPEWAGTCKKVTVGKNKTTIIDANGKSEEIEQRVDDIKSQIDSQTSMFEKEVLQDRLAKFIGGVALLHVGGYTEVEVKERRDRVEDALHATRAAIEEGVLPGGGVALLNFTERVKEQTLADSDYKTGYDIVETACKAPFVSILRNAGYEDKKIKHLLEHYKTNTEFKWEGCDPKTDSFINMYEKGIIDPMKVVRLALENASSVASTLLTTEAIISNVEEESENKQPSAESSMMGMM